MIIKATDAQLRSIAAKLIESEIAEVRAVIDRANKLHDMVSERVERLDRTDRVVAEMQAQRASEIKQVRAQGSAELREVTRQVKQLRGTVERLLLATADRGNRGE